MKSWLSTIEGSRWAVVIPIAVAAVLGISNIGSKSMWLDEAFSASIIQLPTPDLVAYIAHHEMQASPYYLVLQAWSALGHSETALRLLSVIFGVLGVLATYALGRRYGVGLAAAMLLAVSPFFIHYEQEVRVYTLLVAWCAITTLAYLRLVERPNRWRAAGYVVVAVGLIYIHPLNAWMLVAHGLATLLWAPREWRVRLLALYVPVAIAALPIARYLILNRARADWIPGSTPFVVAHQLSQLLGAAALAIALTLVIALGLGRAWRSELPALRLPLLLVALTLGGILLMSLLIQPLFVDRYLIGVLPMLFIVVARAVAALPWPRLVFAGLLAVSLVGTGSWLIDGTKDDWRAAGAYVESHVQPGDGVIIWPNYYRLPFAYYATPGEPLYPSTPWMTLYVPMWGLSIDLPPEVDNQRIWLVRTSHYLPAPDIAALLDDYEAVDTQLFGTEQPEIVLLVRR
ncbi:MAG TPA: glycosyltransferase family 39 protein [Candidatus Limnocylindria bacterium]|nr:glycosyltransferase family 39 protein [Candidatus Limnocylindria bacterium]